ncbi:unnamed protein product [marine sediment metagenome]|uniref:Uncharacterized protein n=1 Tax=marine sediment metagenome TaxID=412755 RepID=X1SK82_9ZZZZ
MRLSQAKKSTDQSNNKPFLLVERQGNGRPAFRLLSIKNPRFNNPGTRLNNHKSPVHISKVIWESILFILNLDNLSVPKTREVD